MNPIGFFFVAAGIFAIAGAVCDWDWFMNARKARFVVALLTRNGARIFYGLLGAGLAVLGVMLALGLIEASR